MVKQSTVPLERPKRPSEMLGLWIGGAVAPLVAVGSLMRRARIFHPRGLYFRAEVDPSSDTESPFHELAQALAQGYALVRLSAGSSRSDRGVLPDVLGCTIRFNIDPDEPTSMPDGAVDLLMITAKSALMLPIAPLLTNQRDFLGNVYYSMGKFELPELSNISLRLVPLTQSGHGELDRYAKIRAAVGERNAAFQLEGRASGEASQWKPIARIYLESELDIDDRETSFWPFSTGQELRPQGFLQFLRPIPYLSSQWARGLKAPTQSSV